VIIVIKYWIGWSRGGRMNSGKKRTGKKRREETGAEKKQTLYKRNTILFLE